MYTSLVKRRTSLKVYSLKVDWPSNFFFWESTSEKRVLSSARALFEKHRFLCNFSLFLVRVRRPELFLQIWLALARCAWRPEA